MCLGVPQTLRLAGGRNRQSQGGLRKSDGTRNKHKTKLETRNTMSAPRPHHLETLAPRHILPPRGARHRHQHGGNDRRQRMARIFGAPAAQDELFFGARATSCVEPHAGHHHLFFDAGSATTRSSHQRPLPPLPPSSIRLRRHLPHGGAASVAGAWGAWGERPGRGRS